jgi:hypothetical protein
VLLRYYQGLFSGSFGAKISSTQIIFAMDYALCANASVGFYRAISFSLSTVKKLLIARHAFVL